MRTTLPFIHQYTIFPELGLYQRKSVAPSPLRSVAPTISQLASTAWSGVGMMLPVLAVPVMVQITIFWDVKLRHTMSGWPSALKSAVAESFQLGASVAAPEIGTGAPTRLVPFMSQNSTWPVAEFQKTRSFSRSALKSSAPTMLQLKLAGTSVRVARLDRVVPFISQTSFWPVVLRRNSRSVARSRSKSPLVQPHE